MTIANCPRCSEQVSVPNDASHEATVRCPLCQDEYSLAEALAELPPFLIVVSDFGEDATSDLDDSEASPWSALDIDDDDAEEVALAPMDDASPAAFDFASGSAPAGGKSKTAIRPSNRTRKPKGSPIKSVLSIVVGGLLAFPIAQLILWYLPGDWKRDFGAGPVVAQYLPQIVPAKFRGNQANTEPDGLDSDSVIPDFSADGFGSFGQPDDVSVHVDETSANQSRNPKKNNNKNSLTNSNAEPPGAELMSDDDATAGDTDIFSSPLAPPEIELDSSPLIDAPVFSPELPSAIGKVNEEPTAEPPAVEDPLATIETPLPEVSSLAPGNIRNAPQVSSDDVAQSVQAAVASNQAWDDDEASSPSGPIKRDFYSALSKLGEALTFVADKSDETVAARIAETAALLHEVGAREDKLAVIGGVAKGWMAAGRESRKTNGICLYGVVKTVEPIGELFETTVESAGQQIAVVSMSDPGEYFAADRQVLILGTILNDPTTNLGGYEGSRAVVVLDGFHVNVSAE